MKIENHTTSRLWFLLISNYNINQFINLITIDYSTILIIDYHWLVSLGSLVGHGSLCLFTCKNIRECCKLFFFHISSRPGSCHFKNLTSCPHFSASPKLSTLNMYNPCFPPPFSIQSIPCSLPVNTEFISKWLHAPNSLNCPPSLCLLQLTCSGTLFKHYQASKPCHINRVIL